MIASVLALVIGALTSAAATSSITVNPFASDKLLLLRASRSCHVHDGAVYFIQRSRMEAPSVHTTRALGDSDAQITCVLQSLPADFVARYRIEAEAPPVLQKERGTGADEHRRVSGRR